MTFSLRNFRWHLFLGALYVALISYYSRNIIEAWNSLDKHLSLSSKSGRNSSLSNEMHAMSDPDQNTSHDKVASATPLFGEKLGQSLNRTRGNHVTQTREGSELSARDGREPNSHNDTSVTIRSTEIANSSFLGVNMSYSEKQFEHPLALSAGTDKNARHDAELSNEQLRAKNASAFLSPNGVDARNSSLKTILFWTGFYNESTWWNSSNLNNGREAFLRYKCQYDQCTFTSDRSRLEEASLLLFFYSNPPEWPEQRYTHQYYAHVMVEPPSEFQREFLQELNGKINITVNYRLDADIRCPEGGWVESKRPAKKARERTIQKGDDDDEVYVLKTPLAERLRSVFWLVSHCGAASGRDEYVRELAKYIDVDIYGDCGNLTCPRGGSPTCYQTLAPRYKFYLSFENQLCTDYVTEKLYMALKAEVIPVVLGRANYGVLAPPHSVIDVRDYRSPRHLAKYLRYLSKNETAYNAYYQYRTKYRSYVSGVVGTVCQFCALLHDGRYPEGKPAKEDYVSWWFDGMCDNKLVDRMRAKGNW